MNKNIMNNIGLLGIIALIMAILIACDSAGGDPDSSPTTPINLYAWGRNSKGQLGIGIGGESAGDKSVLPVEVVGNKTWSKVSGGGGHTVAIDRDGHLYAWGDNSAGQLGIGTETVDGNEVLVNKNKPVKVGDKTWNQVSAGDSHTVAIDSADELYAWGSNEYGQLGIGTETVDGNEVLVNKNKPVKVGDKTWNQVSAGFQHTVAIDNADKLYVWGSTYDKDSNRNTIYQDTPDEVVIATDTTKTWKQVSAGGAADVVSAALFGYTMAIDNNNHLYAWGKNNRGQLGSGDTDDSTSPIQIGTETWNQVSAGGFHTVAIGSDGALYTWGANVFGQLGSGDTDDSTAPVKRGDTTETWKQVSAGRFHTVAIGSDGALYAWGNNDKGQLGDGNSGANVKSISPIKIGDQTWNQVNAGGESTLGIIQ